MTISSDSLRNYKATEILKDGSVLHLRAIRQDDMDGLREFFFGLSPKSMHLRFHRAVTELPREEVARLCSADYEDVCGLVGTAGEDGEEIIANAHLFRIGKTDSAEITIIVTDRYQGRGVGGYLLNHIAEMAKECNIRYLESEVLAKNKPMMKLLKNKGYRLRQGLDQGIYHVVLEIIPPEEPEETPEAMERAEVAARVTSFLKPRSIALIGASRKPKSVGDGLLHNILDQGYNGLVFPVNPKLDVIASIKAYHSVFDIQDDLELAIVAVPAEKVQEVVAQCGQKGVKGIVIISAGFAEGDEEGARRQEAVLRTIREYGMSLIGPNCLGVMNTDPHIRLNSTLSSACPPPGNIGICSQGGTLGRALLEYAYNQNIGISMFVNLGNRADISSNDLMQYWEEDPDTDVILLYLESFGNPRKFTRIASRVAASKPILTVHRGRIQTGFRGEHLAGAPLITTEVPSEELFDQIGVIRCDTMRQLFNVSTLIATQPLPKGNRVAIISNGKGPASITAHACIALGLQLPRIMDITASELKGILPRRATLENPIDMTAEASAEEYERTLRLLVEDEEVDCVIAICIPPVDVTPDSVLNAIKAAAPYYYKRGKTLVTSLSGVQGHNIQISAQPKRFVPSYDLPETAANALVKAYKYTEWLKKPKGNVPEFDDVDRERGLNIVKSVLEAADSGRAWLDFASANELLTCYGVPVAEIRIATGVEEAVQAAEEIGFPVAIKLFSKTIVLRAEVGGVILGVKSAGGVERAFDRIRSRVRKAGREQEMQGVIVQEIIEGSVEVMTGVTQVPSFGPVMMFGAGGVFAELFRDMAYHVHPLTDVTAGEMVRSVKASRLLDGFKGAKPKDTQFLEQLILRISTMIADLPQIAEMDLNPIKALGKDKGCVVIDARILLTTSRIII